MPSSTSFVVISWVDVKDWWESTPSVDEVRPKRCPHCGGASRPVGAGLMIWGHGLRARLFLGIFSIDGTPQDVTIDIRRYLCRYDGCGKTITVLPRQAVPGRRYLLGTIVLALAMWTVAATPLASHDVRHKLSPFQLTDHHTSWRCWPQMFRWADVPQQFGVGLRDEMDRRGRAERIVQSFIAKAPPSTRGDPLEERAFVGAFIHPV
jgi:hypothetical protein